MHTFYRAFEDRFRGKREMIAARLTAYLPFLTPLSALQPQAQAFDIGCGRGEWLEMLGQHDFYAHGVDLDEGMLAACRELGLNATQGDAIATLASLPDASHAVISALHVVEHIPFESLQSLMTQALRVLAPGGLLILETPNPENISVSTSSFYLDPSHTKPIPSSLLSFLAEYTGFARVKTIGLQEPPGLRQNGHPALYDVFKGVSPDYALVAQKGGSLEWSAHLDDAFDTPFGLSLEQLSANYDTAVWNAFAIQNKELRLQSKQLSDVSNTLDTTRAELEAQSVRLASVEYQLNQQRQPAVKRWRSLTLPLRHKIKLLAKHALLFVNRRPLLHRLYRGVLRRIASGVLARVDGFLNAHQAAMRQDIEDDMLPLARLGISTHTLSPRARAIAEAAEKLVKPDL